MTHHGFEVIRGGSVAAVAMTILTMAGLFSVHGRKRLGCYLRQRRWPLRCKQSSQHEKSCVTISQTIRRSC